MTARAESRKTRSSHTWWGARRYSLTANEAPGDRIIRGGGGGGEGIQSELWTALITG